MKPSLIGLLSLGFGIYYWLLATGRVGARPDDPRYRHWQERFSRPLRTISVLLVIFGVLTCVGLLL